MFINAARPQVVSGDGQHYQLQPKQKQQKQGNLGTVASDSRLRQRAIAKKLLRNCNRNRFNQLTPDDIRAWSAAVLSQSQLTQHFHRRRYPQDADQVQNHQQQQALLQHPVAVPVPVPRPRPWPITKMEWRAIDSRSSDQSDDSFLPEDFCSGMSGIGLDTPNSASGLQTAATGYVSVPPSHYHLNNGFNKGLENGWPAPPMAAMYHSHVEAFDGQHSFSPVFDHGYHHHHPGFVVDGLPGAWDQTMPLFAEHVDYGSCSSNNNSQGVSPVTSFGSSFSSVASVSDMVPGNSYTMNIDPVPLATHQHATSELANTTAFSNHHNANITAGEQTTVSPKVLRINPSPVPPPDSSTEYESFRDNGDWGSSSLEPPQHQQPQTHNPLYFSLSKRSTPKARKELPDKPKSRHHYQHQPTAPLEPPSSSEGRSSSANAPAPPEQVVDTFVEQSATQQQPSSKLAAQLCPMSSTKKIPATVETKPSDRSKKDEFLVKSKLAGMPYKEIRRKGGFTEAESTLRGRFRTLTKKKEERVRKPEWSDDDVRLLKKAVRKLGKGNDPASLKVPWKQIAEYIADKGGYHFGNATCRKRWDELVEQGKAAFK